MGDVYQAKVVRLGDVVEEEVELLIQGRRLVCFSSVYSSAPREGQIYSVSLELMVIEDFKIEEIEETTPSILRIGNGFAYELRGRLLGDTLDVGIVFREDAFLSCFGHLEGRFVSVRVDRIDVEFLGLVDDGR
jgi:hypothetical protein